MTAPGRANVLVRLQGIAARLVRELPWRSAALWLVVLINIALIALFFWSRRGQEITVHGRIDGSYYVFTIDGTKVASGQFPDHAPGGIGLRLKSNDRIASIAGPIGIESVKITDAASDNILFEDNFDGSADSRWKVANGVWDVKGGVLETSTGGLITVTDPSWRNYEVVAKLRNVEDLSLFVSMKDSASTLQADFTFFRSYRTTVQYWRDGEPVSSTAGSTIVLNEQQSIRAITAMVLRPYPAMLLLLLITTLIALTAGWLRIPAVERTLSRAGSLILGSSEQLMIALCVFAFALLWYILFFVSDDMPHVPDSVLYVFQSKIFASGHLYAHAPPARESFSIFSPHMDQVVDGRWFSHYPFGHPMFLAIGQLVHFPSLVPPLLGAGCVALIYVIGRRAFGAATGLLAAALLTFSPFFEMTASDYMSHNTAAFVILACLALYTWNVPWRWAAMFASGACFGLLFNVRPLPAISFLFPLAALMVYDFVRATSAPRTRILQYAAFAAGALVLFGCYLLYNKATTGHPFESGYAEQGTFSEDTFGFGGTHSVARGLQNQHQLLALMQIVADGWPVLVGFGIAMLPFIFGTRSRWDYFAGASFLSLAGMNIFYLNAAVMNGPRFWYESLPFLLLLTARGAMMLIDTAAATADWVHRRVTDTPPSPNRPFAGAWVLAVVTALMVFSASGWLFQTRQAWAGLPFTPAKISELENFNYSDDRLLKIADEMDLHNALVFVKKCSAWWCFGAEFWTNSPTLDGDIVWAEQQGRSDDVTLLDHYPDRDVYLADYDSEIIEPVTRDEIRNTSFGAKPGPGVEP